MYEFRIVFIYECCKVHSFHGNTLNVECNSKRMNSCLFFREA